MVREDDLAISFISQSTNILKRGKLFKSLDAFLYEFRLRIKEQTGSKLFRKSIEFFRETKARSINLWDKEYPELLMQLPDPPIVLFLLGNVELLSSAYTVGIVGARKATVYGLNAAMSFGMKLAARDAIIVSGMAVGVDTYAHRGALKAKGKTIAVIGSGFADIYPRENKDLFEQIVKNGGLVISEFPPFMPPLRQNFPRRNRIISGLSRCLLVIEAGMKSGALITANFSMELGRDVFSLPGQIDSYASQGTNMLIYDGAIPLISIEDVLKCLGISNDIKAVKGDRVQNSANNPIFIVLERLGRATLQEICDSTNLPVKRVLNDIMQLELTGIVIRQGPYICIKE